MSTRVRGGRRRAAGAANLRDQQASSERQGDSLKGFDHENSLSVRFPRANHSVHT